MQSLSLVSVHLLSVIKWTIRDYWCLIWVHLVIKNSLNNFICHLSWLKKTFPHSYTSSHIHLWIFRTLQVITFWVKVTCKMLDVNCIKIHSIILSVTCHGLRDFPHLIQIPLIYICEDLLDSKWIKIHNFKLLSINYWLNFLCNSHSTFYELL